MYYKKIYHLNIYKLESGSTKPYQALPIPGPTICSTWPYMALPEALHGTTRPIWPYAPVCHAKPYQRPYTALLEALHRPTRGPT